MQEKSALELELEKARLPPDYNTYSGYSKMQQFRSYVVSRLADGSCDELIQTKKIKFEDRKQEGDHTYITRIHITDPKEVRGYIQSALYRKAVADATNKVRRAALYGGLLSNETAMNSALNELMWLVSMRPYVFKETYQECLSDLEETAKPLLALVWHVEECLLRALEDHQDELPSCQEEWNSEFAECAKHFEQLK